MRSVHGAKPVAEKGPDRTDGNVVNESVLALRKSEMLTLFLAVIVPGVGHMFIGRTMRGFAFLMVEVVMMMAAMFGWALSWGVSGMTSPVVIAILPFMLLIWIWSVIDAYMSVRNYNETLLRTGVPPVFGRRSDDGRR